VEPIWSTLQKTAPRWSIFGSSDLGKFALRGFSVKKSRKGCRETVSSDTEML
jgi:hypothetical protein